MAQERRLNITSAKYRTDQVQRGKILEYFTILWNSLEALVALISGLLAGSVALVGFGFDSVIEVTSGVALLWRLRLDNSARREHAEKLTLQIVGTCFIALAAYVLVDSLKSLLQYEAPNEVPPGSHLLRSPLS